MDPLDLIVGSEGTLCVITEISLRLTPAPRGEAWLLVTTSSEAQALGLVTALREASVSTRRTGDPAGLDVAAIEHLDARSLALLHEDGTDRRLRIGPPGDTSVLLLANLELQEALPRAALVERVASALDAGGADGPIARLCRILDRHGLLDRAEIVAAEDVGRVRQLIALREAVPAAVNARIAQARARIDPRIEKTAADMIVPFARFDALLARSRQVFEQRGLDYAVWGHVSDGNVHPNALPRSWEDIGLARDAVLELGRAVIAMGGSPLAEHGVGRNPVKQRLLRELYGEPGLADMRAVKSALDPSWTLAPGVIFSPAS